MGARGRLSSNVFLPVVAALLFGTTGGLVALKAQNSGAQEITTQETQPTFKVQVQRNIVLVRVVVRDLKGNPVTSLKKEDFRLYDNGKPQVISHFAVENSPTTPRTAPTPTPSQPDEEAQPESVLAPSAPRNYLALYFDDVQMAFEDLARSRDAADRYLATALHPDDRVALFTSSGQNIVDFTEDRTKLHEELFKLRPRPVVNTQARECPQINDYVAYMVVHQRDPFAIAAITEETYQCYYQNLPMSSAEAHARAQVDAEGYAVQTLNLYETHIEYALRGLEVIVRQMSALPGRHNLIFVSPGFLSSTLQAQIEEIIDRALRSNVVINTLDCKGLYTIIPYGDATQRPVVIPARPDLMGRKSQLIIDGYAHDEEVLRNFAMDTGGVFIHNTNDLDAGFRQIGSLATGYYTLAFSPQSLKLDGKFHNLKVGLMNSSGLTVQARRGYFAPRKLQDPALQAKQEIEQAIFSQDELKEIPVDVHTQFFKFNESDARLAVLTHLDLHVLRFRKEEGRNFNKLTFVTALFDRDGKYLTGNEKRLELRLRDMSLEKLLQSGITMKSTFNLKPGTYLVREVIRDSEGGQLSGLNRTVEIPF
jgi:VWFA-related protein